LAIFGVASVQYPGLTGVWIQPHKQSPSIGSSQGANPLPTKIAAIGVKVDARGISRHGFALNVQQDKAYWEGIIGCGLEDYQVTCIAELLIPAPTIDSVANSVIAAFGEEFDYRMEIKPP
jgi:lipoyl(octanoyl) transferase